MKNYQISKDLINFNNNYVFFFIVNDEPVSDGAAGCERAKLIMACAIENKAEVKNIPLLL